MQTRQLYADIREFWAVDHFCGMWFVSLKIYKTERKLYDDEYFNK